MSRRRQRNGGENNTDGKYVQDICVLVLMEEILHHPTCTKPCKYITGYLPYQLVQDFFHQQYQVNSKKKVYIST